MNELPLARVTMAHALKHGNDLIIYVEGFTSGFGGKLIVQRSSNLILPTEFNVFAEPGNDGINPGASPQSRPTTDAYVFVNEGHLPAILLQGAGHRQELQVIAVRTPDSP